ncbi:chemotaxis response regulator protein-glutamate methylesterase [Brevibacillus sp. B_LB10_24]|uniref:protein-glutamate methylesterase/protein-glutamine glutaminase n=1 Tax=Brevibacillus sp. B_LB10_24 TaxID=3380645 RepID=UPI0038B7691E
MKNIRVLVVDDSAFMRKVITDILGNDPGIEVVGQARNGRECLQKVKEHSPDVVTLDIEMPVMNGLETLEKLMSLSPLPVIMLSSLTTEGATATVQALELGAFDFVAKPSGPISLDIHKVADELIERVKLASVAKRKPWQVPLPKAPKLYTPLPNVKPGRKIVALGTSTGGPKALQSVLTSLPASFPAPILIVQHMPPGFTKSLAQRLDALSAIRVVEAAEGDEILPGTAYIAPGGYHLQVRENDDGRLYASLNQSEPRGGLRPAVDVLFESVGKLQNIKKWAVIMTGMGSDGTKGLKIMKEQGTVTSVIEAESSCVVFGMPRSAIQAGLADQIVPLEQIAETLVRIVI